SRVCELGRIHRVIFSGNQGFVSGSFVMRRVAVVIALFALAVLVRVSVSHHALALDSADGVVVNQAVSTQPGAQFDRVRRAVIPSHHKDHPLVVGAGSQRLAVRSFPSGEGVAGGSGVELFRWPSGFELASAITGPPTNRATLRVLRC